MRTKFVLLATVFPIGVADLWYNGAFLVWAVKFTLVGYIILCGIAPMIFHFSHTVQRKILFLNFMHWPLNIDLTRPESVGLEGARNFYLTTDKNVKLGVWQILPKSLLNRSIPVTEEAYLTELKNSKQPVFLYVHGNSGNRASSHRLELYKLFQKLDYHVICFDYRSYGDSEDVALSEMGVVDDTRFMLQFVMEKVNSSAPIFVWGHSLGTGVSTHVLKILAGEGSQPAGLLLESPFNNLAQEVAEHPFSQIFKHLPWFYWMVVEPFTVGDMVFASDKNIAKIECPIMIFHAEDDPVIPFSLGEKLYEAALRSHGNDTKQVQMTRIKSSLGLGHTYICRLKDLPNIVEKFVAEASKH